MASPAGQPPVPGGRAGYRLPLRLHITALILLLVGAITLVLGSVVERTSQDLVDATVEASLAASADLALQELQRHRERTTAAAEALAAHPVVDTTTRRERLERLSLLVTILQSVPGGSAAYVGWPNGDFVLLRPIGRHADRMRAPPAARWLVQWAGGEGARFEFVDGDLALVESRSELSVAFDPRLRPWFIEAGGKAEPILTAPYIFFATREPGITAARKSRSGAIAGVDVAIWELSARLPKGRPVPSAEAAVIDDRGGVVAYTDAARLQAVADRKTSADHSLEAERLPTAKEIGSPVLEALAAKAGSMPRKYYGTLTIAGRDWLATIVPLDQRGASFVMAAPADELGQGVRSVRARLLQILGLALLVVVPAAWLIGRAVAKPVERFTADVKKIARFDFAPSPPLTTRVSELARLDDMIRSMRSTLRERMKELRCIYAVLDLTADSARPAGAVCTEVARLLPTSMMHEDAAVARIVLEGHEYLSEYWQMPAAALRAEIAGAEPPGGFVEVGYRDARPDQPNGEGPFLKEERDLVDAVAAHIARMLQGRHMAAELARSERLGAVGRLTGGISHDFNNLLTIILGNADLLRQKLAGDPELCRLAETTIRAAERGADLTKQLLAFSRRQSLEPKPVDVNALLAAMKDLLLRALSANVDLQLKLAPEAWPALVDAAQLESAILNLCINSRDAMPGGGTLVIASANLARDAAAALGAGEIEPGDYVVVSVADTGIGMDKATAEHAFEPFFTTKGIDKGTGLGLSMVYGFAKQSQGLARIESSPGNGTTVLLYLPRAGECAPADTGEAKA